MSSEGLTGSAAGGGVITRRTLLGGVVGGAITAATAGAVRAGATTPGQDRPGERDVIVVGAGFAGVTAARELAARGLRPLVLEARRRIGGRAYTDTYLGHRVEFGAQWLHPDYTLVYRELARYGIGTISDAPIDRVLYPTGTGEYRTVDPVATSQRVGEVLTALFAGSEEYYARPHEPLYRADLIRELHDVSLRQRLDSLGLSPQDRSLVAGMLENYSGGDSSAGALTSLAQWWALCGFTAEGWFAQSAASPATGMAGLAGGILAESGAQLRLNSPVTSITDNGSAVTVRTRDGGLFTAPAVVLAVPVNVWRTIRFDPVLPPAHTAATAEGVGITPAAAKLWLRVSGVSDRVLAQGDEGDPILALIPFARLTNGDQLMIAGNGTGLNLNSRDAVQAAVRRMLPGASVTDVRVQNWATDPYSLGGWALRKPGQLLRQLPYVQQPHGRVAFATADIASGWNAAIEGAVESGFRAAAQVAGLLSRSVVGAA